MINNDTYQPEGNYFDKYNNTNFIVRRLMDGFMNSIHSLVSHALVTSGCESVLEAGCGEGHVTNYIHQNFSELNIKAFDISENVIKQAKEDYPEIHFSTGSIYNIEAVDEAYDLIVASEVLEHLEEPEKALDELMRATKKYVLISVPNEPIWCFLNLVRGKYLKRLGNTPGHVQHWSRKRLLNFISDNEQADICKTLTPLPWTMVLVEKRNKKN